MTTYQEKAEAYVRQQLPELRETIYPAGDQNFFYLVEDKSDHWLGIWDGTAEVVGIHKTSVYGSRDAKELALQHWLNCLHPKIGPDAKIEAWVGNRIKIWTGKTKILFNLTTGQPATEADYSSLCDILGV